MAKHGTKEYRRDMAAIHDEVVRTGEPAVITKDGKPYVRIVPETDDSTLRALADAGVVIMPSHRRIAVEPIDAGGDDSTEIIADNRR
ncbi:type II toxin-antitoxin system Phd/YefM family antitoxin [Amycolatopsis sp. GM8]|uniref:type II toxin-antitoxin system Phd/YefM family antitoxin n=1 Tax=Amycolatopsis sp. GM8 TaxID=2896530 RepID=UPI001F2DDD56|nr:type II toxin-antitoxin system Phd/YefM family antitoxin [Amycolatopsis sp. GM8]